MSFTGRMECCGKKGMGPCDGCPEFGFVAPAEPGMAVSEKAEITVEREAVLFAEIKDGELWMDTCLSTSHDLDDELVDAMFQYVMNPDANVEIVQKFRIEGLVDWFIDSQETTILRALMGDMAVATALLREEIERRANEGEE